MNTLTGMAGLLERLNPWASRLKLQIPLTKRTCSDTVDYTAADQEQEHSYEQYKLLLKQRS